MKFDRSITFLFALASFFIFASDDVRATLDQTDTISPAENGGTPALHVIGIYEGTTPKDGDNRLLSNRCNGDLGNKQQHAPPPSGALVLLPPSSKCLTKAEGNVIVNITDSTKPIVLALMAYNKNHWKVRLGKGVKITKLILAGYHSQRVSGLSVDIPVETYTYDPSPCATCLKGAGYFYADESPPAQLKEITGLDPSSFQGGYTGDEFFIFPGMKIVKSLSAKNSWETKAVQEVPKTAPPLKVVDPQTVLDQAIQKRVIRKATPDDVNAFRDAYTEKKYIKNGLPVPKEEDALSVTNVDVSRAYVVLKKFAYPSGMINENRVVFFIPKGVPEPSGKYGHSAIYYFDSLTAECTAARTGEPSC